MAIRIDGSNTAAVVAAAALVAACALSFILLRLSTTVYVCKRVYSFKPGLPQNANAVAVRGGKIVSVGPLEKLRLSGRVDRTFAGKYIVPGLVDPRVSVVLSSAVFGLDSIVAPEPWILPHATFPAARSPAEYTRELRAALERTPMGGGVFVTFGHFAPVHGPLTRGRLDDISNERPIAVWQRCGSSFVLNTAALERLRFFEGDYSRFAGASVEEGTFGPSALRLLCSRLFADIGMANRLESGVARLKTYLLGHGITAIGDVACSAREANWIRARLGNAPLGVRLVMRPHVPVWKLGFAGGTRRMAKERSASRGPSSNVDWAPAEEILLQTDGTVVQQAHQKKFNDISGKWVYAPAASDDLCRWFARRQVAVAYEANGDFALEIALGHVHKRLYEGAAVKNPRFFVQHCGDIDDVAAKLKKARGAVLSTTPHLAWASLAAAGDTVAPLASLNRRRIQCGIHSHMPFGAPSDPIGQAAMACWYRPDAGERVDRYAGLAAVTRMAAAALRLERAGSIQPGKSFEADLCILEEDPLTAKEPRVWGVVYRGKKHPAAWKRGKLGGALPPPPSDAGDSVPDIDKFEEDEACAAFGVQSLLAQFLR